MFDTDTKKIEEHWLGGFEPYGVTVNNEPARTLFGHYERCGFLYPAKRTRLAPVMTRVMETWDRTMRPAEDQMLQYCVNCNACRPGTWGSMSFWRSTPNRAHAQHLVNTGSPNASRLVMLAAQDAWHARGGLFVENWFRAENRFANRIFGTATERIGVEHSSLERRSLLAVPRGWAAKTRRTIAIEQLDSAAGCQAKHTLGILADPVVAAAEELDDGDINMRGLDEEYRAAGLRRYRRVFLAALPGCREPVGIAIAYRGPIGLNFSFLENRCDLWISRELDHSLRHYIAQALIGASESVYEDLALNHMVVACDEETHAALSCRHTGMFIRTYSRCVWSRPGFWQWYCHADSFYQRILDFEQRRRGSDHKQYTTNGGLV